MFIAIDGGDGTGKSGQAAFLKNWLQTRGVDVVAFRDPGDSALGEELRTLLLKRRDVPVCAASETALFMAARAQLVNDNILPALKLGKTVLIDRYLTSTVVYQGFAIGGDVAAIWRTGRFFVGDVLPDVTLILDCPVDVAFRRLNRPKDRVESRGAEYHRKVRDGFRSVVRDWEKFAPGRAFLIDASQTPEQTSRAIVERLEPFFPSSRATSPSV